MGNYPHVDPVPRPVGFLDCPPGLELPVRPYVLGERVHLVVLQPRLQVGVAAGLEGTTKTYYLGVNANSILREHIRGGDGSRTRREARGPASGGASITTE